MSEARYAAWPLITVGVLSGIWTPALRRGFSDDDFNEVPFTWSELIANPLINTGRPVEALTFMLLPNHALIEHAASLVLYLACLWLMWRLCQRMALGQWSTLFALSSFFHPAFLWNVTWIAHRADLLVIFFLLLAVGTTRASAKLFWIALCSAAKTPFILQNIVFSLQFARRGALTASAMSILLLLVFGFAGYTTRYAETVSEGRDMVSVWIAPAIGVPLSVAKLLEGILNIFAPIPMFAVAPWGPVVALLAYGLFWFLLARSLRPFRPCAVNGWIPAMTMTMCVPFVFMSEVRVAGIAAVLAFLAIASAATQWRLSGKIAVVGILVLNLSGISLNYGIFRSQEYDIHATPVSSDYSQPAYVYLAWRQNVRDRILAALGVNVPVKTVE